MDRNEMGPGAVDPEKIEPQVSADIEIIARRELALRAVDAISEVLEVDVSVRHLLVLAEDPEPSDVRLAARHALRCVEAIGRPDSPVIRTIGEVGIYHYVEGVVEYGAAEQTYLTLMENLGLTAEEVTGLYEVRRVVAEQTDGHMQGFPTLIKALRSIGIAPQQAALDPEQAVAALVEAGYIVDHIGGKVFDRPIFSPRLAAQVPLSYDRDTPRTLGSIELLRLARELGEGIRRLSSDEAEEE